MPQVTIKGEWDQPEPDWAKVTEALMEQGVYDIDVNSDDDSNAHGWGV